MNRLLRNLIGRAMTRDASGVRALSAERVAELNGSKAGNRALELAGVDVESRTVELSFSSEVEVERYGWIEILDHGPGAVDLSRLDDSAAALMDHEWRDQVGVVVPGATRVEGGKGRTKIKFSRSVRGQEVFQDVQDQIRKLVSVGYIILDAVLQEVRDGVEVIRVTRWQPYEVSFVAVPADRTVGVGRSAEIPQMEPTAPVLDNQNVRQSAGPQTTARANESMKVKIVTDAAGNLVRAEVDDADNIIKVLDIVQTAAERQAIVTTGTTGERNRVSAITAMGERFKAPAELVRKALSEGQTPEQFQGAILEHVEQRSKRPLAEQHNEAGLGMDERSIERYSFLNVARWLANPDQANTRMAGHELDLSRQAQDKANREANGVMVPADVLTRALSTSTDNGAGNGGFLVDTTLASQSFVDMLRKKTRLLQLGFVMGGLSGNIDIPRKISGSSGYWLGEDEDAQETGAKFDQISLTPKTVGAYTDITRKMLQQSSIGAEALMRRDLASGLGETIDRAGWYGLGTDKQPRGVFMHDGLSAVVFANQFPTYKELVAMETEIAADDADTESMRYLMHTRCRGALKTTEKFGGTNGATVWETGNTVNGYPADVTNQLQTGDTAFGNWSDLIVALWGGLDLNIDKAAKAKSGGLRLIGFQDVDFALRRTESFCIGRKP